MRQDIRISKRRGKTTKASLMKACIRRLIALCFLSRIVFYYIAEFDSFIWQEIYWFLNWIILIYFTFLIRHLVSFVNLSTDTIRVLRSELLKLGLLFASLLLWEVLYCINQEVANSGLMTLCMLFITASLAAWMILSAKD